MSRSAMRTGIAIVAALAVAVLGATAQASITIDQLYSNFDGTIQFIVLGRSGDPLPSLAGRTLIATDGVTSNRYTFPADVSADRNHPRVLVATQGFADLGKVAPDYIVPAGFLPLANGSVALDEAALDYTGRRLPTDGWHALYRDAFSGSSEVFVAAATNSHAALYAFARDPTLTGLWWNPAQPGWGVAVEQQADALFTLWATHDANGSPTWFYAIFAPVILPCDDPLCDGPTVTGAWSGTLYATTGPPSSAGSYDPSRVVSTQAGTIALQQLPPVTTGEGSFDFAIGDTSGHRTFTRAVFGDPVRQCFLTPAVVPGPPNYQGLWWNPSEPGWALQLNHQGDVIFAIWFTYDEAGRATWLSFTASRATSGAYAGTLYRTTGTPFTATPDPAATTNAAVGTASLTFADASHGTFTAEMNGSPRTRAIEREQLASVPPVCD